MNQRAAKTNFIVKEKKCKTTYKSVENSGSLTVEECAAMTTYDKARGNCNGGSNYFTMAKNADSTWNCECCLADASVADNIEDDTDANIYKAGGDALLFTQTCNVKSKLMGMKSMTVTTATVGGAARELSCGEWNYEWYGVSNSGGDEIQPSATDAFVSFVQTVGADAVNYPDAVTIQSAPTWAAYQ